jgi:hypothetical protein
LKPASGLLPDHALDLALHVRLSNSPEHCCRYPGTLSLQAIGGAARASRAQPTRIGFESTAAERSTRQ